MRGGAVSRLAASPVMVGAVTVLIAILAVFLAYNANNGLPFVPTYRISAQVSDANTLLPGNEVRIGGVRVGVVEDVEPISHEDGSVSAKLDLSLDSEVEPLPTDSTILVRARSALGLKYLEISRGTSSEGYPAGAIMPLSAAETEPVDIDQVLNTFDEPTRVAVQANLVEFGNALAGRGPTLNSAIGRLRPLLPRLERVMTNLADRDTKLGRFFSALSDTAAEVAPVAAQQGDMFVALDTTFTALSERRAAVHPGDDLRERADSGHRHRGAAADPSVPRPQRSALRRPAARDRLAAGERVDDRLGARGRRRRCSSARPSSTTSSRPRPLRCAG